MLELKEESMESEMKRVGREEEKSWREEFRLLFKLKNVRVFLFQCVF